MSGYTAKRTNEVEVAIYKDTILGYGFSIMGGDPVEENPDVNTPILISKLKLGAPAEKTGLIKVGHEVLAINGVNMVGQTHDDVVKQLQQATDGLVMLKLKTVNKRTTTDVVLAQLGYEVVRCLFPFTAQNEDELSLKRDDIVFVKGKGSDGWCFGQSQASGAQGMFPGQFVMKLKVGPEILTQIAAELESLVPGISDGAHRCGSEVLYEELDSPMPGMPAEGRKALNFQAENLYERLDADSTMGSKSSKGSAKGSTAMDAALYPLARPDGVSSRVVLIGKEVFGETVTPSELPVTSRGHQYAPINTGGAGEVVYEPTPFQAAQMAPADDTVVAKPEIEDLYASVNKIVSNDGDDDTSRRVDINDDMYATLESLQRGAPEVPVRKYDKNLLPPTMRIHLASTHDEVEDAGENAYELLPGQKEFDLDENTSADSTPMASPEGLKPYDKLKSTNVTPSPITSPVGSPTKSIGSPGSPGDGAQPPPLPVRKASQPDLSSALFPPSTKDEKKRLKDQQKQAKKNEKQQKKDAKAKEKELKKKAKEAKKGKGEK